MGYMKSALSWENLDISAGVVRNVWCWLWRWPPVLHCMSKFPCQWLVCAISSQLSPEQICPLLFSFLLLFFLLAHCFFFPVTSFLLLPWLNQQSSNSSFHWIALEAIADALAPAISRRCPSCFHWLLLIANLSGLWGSSIQVMHVRPKDHFQVELWKSLN